MDTPLPPVELAQQSVESWADYRSALFYFPPLTSLALLRGATCLCSRPGALSAAIHFLKVPPSRSRPQKQTQAKGSKGPTATIWWLYIEPHKCSCVSHTSFIIATYSDHWPFRVHRGGKKKSKQRRGQMKWRCHRSLGRVLFAQVVLMWSHGRITAVHSSRCESLSHHWKQTEVNVFTSYPFVRQGLNARDVAAVVFCEICQTVFVFVAVKKLWRVNCECVMCLFCFVFLLFGFSFNHRQSWICKVALYFYHSRGWKVWWLLIPHLHRVTF